MDPVVHFEMPYEDSQRAADFYSKVFDWKMNMLGPEMGEYIMATTSKTDEKGFPLEKGMINGGFYKKDQTAPAPSVVISTKDIKTTMDKIIASGGKVLNEPMEIPGIGTYISFLDTEGNRVGVLQPLPM